MKSVWGEIGKTNPLLKALAKMKFVKKIENFLLICGLCLLVFFVGSRVYRVVVSSAKLTRFKSLQTQQAPVQQPSLVENPLFKLDLSLWSQKRIAAYEQSL